jgi:hypothetical protein
MTLRRKIAARSEVRDIVYSQLSKNDDQARGGALSKTKR